MKSKLYFLLARTARKIGYFFKWYSIRADYYHRRFTIEGISSCNVPNETKIKMYQIVRNM